jgi:hypothetical protein
MSKAISPEIPADLTPVRSLSDWSLNMATRPTPTGLPTPPESPRANSPETGRDKVRGWLPEAAKKSDPQGTAYVRVGPGTPAWHAKAKGK